jgi:hypothetical protein
MASYKFLGGAWRKTKQKDFSVHETVWLLVSADSDEEAAEKAEEGLKKFLRPEGGYSQHTLEIWAGDE